MAETVSLVIKWAGKEYPITELPSGTTVLELKNIIQERTNVLPSRQRLLNLKFKGKPASDELVLSSLDLKPGAKIMMMGSSEQAIQDVSQGRPSDPTVINDFEEEAAQKLAVEFREEYLEKVEKRVKSYEIQVQAEPREGKKLLVLDIDYTLFDHRSVAENGTELMRPFLHEFLTSAYEVRNETDCCCKAL